MYENYHAGWVECITGSMFSGKSEELIRRLRRGLYAKQKVIVFKPQIDDRYSEDEVVSHNGNKVKAYNVKHSNEIINLVNHDIDIVAIDEIQFFDNEVVDVVTTLANRGHRVIVAGLDMDFKGVPFEPVPELMAIAEHVTKLQAVCSVCGAPSSRTQRLINGEPAHINDPIILIGAKESYEPRCREHHIIRTN